MLNKKNTITLFTLIAIILMMVGCSAETQSPIDDGGLTVEEGQPIDDGGLTVEEGQPIDDGGLTLPIEDTAWKLLAIRDFDALLAADMDSPAIIEFKADGTFHMSTGCGEMGGIYTLDGETISFEVQMTTVVADCTEIQVAQALAIESLMQDVTSYSISGETLTLSIDENNDAKFEQLHKIDDGGLVVDGSMDTEFVGMTWLWERFDDAAGSNNIVVDDPTLYTLVLNADGLYQVKADCNLASGSYTLEGNSIIFEAGPATLAECEPESLYNTFLTNLANVATFAIDGENLVLHLGADAGSMVFSQSPE